MLILFMLSFLIGLSTGIITFIFGTGLNLISNFIILAFPYNLILLPLVGLLTIVLRDRFKSEVNGSMPRIFHATRKDDELSILIIPFQFLTTWFAHLAGASVGREGVAVQLGATTSNVIATKFPDLDRTVMTRIGMAAGFAGLFGTPLAATVFCFEVTKKKAIKLEVLGATLIATFTANIISAALGLNHFHVETVFKMFTFREMIFFIFCILAFAAVGHLFALLLARAKAANNNFKINDYQKVFILSVIGALLIYTINDGRYMSLGTNIINDAFYNPQNIHALDFVFKTLLTVYFVSIGFQGGEVTPLFAIGSSLGVVLSYIFVLPYQIVGAIGYAFVFGNATNAYFASAVLVIEVFGFAVMPYAIIALAITLFIRNDSHTIYPNLDWE